jgi:predicted aldo/keto reductase-like oxidoreductase
MISMVLANFPIWVFTIAASSRYPTAIQSGDLRSPPYAPAAASAASGCTPCLKCPFGLTIEEILPAEGWVSG